MSSPQQVQPWKLNQSVMDYRAMHTQAGTPSQPSTGRANFYPAGEMMHNGGQDAGTGNADAHEEQKKTGRPRRAVLYDTL